MLLRSRCGAGLFDTSAIVISHTHRKEAARTRGLLPPAAGAAACPISEWPSRGYPCLQTHAHCGLVLLDCYGARSALSGRLHEGLLAQIRCFPKATSPPSSGQRPKRQRRVKKKHLLGVKGPGFSSGLGLFPPKPTAFLKNI